MSTLARASNAKGIAAALIVALAAVSVSGCRTDDSMALMLNDPTKRHPITFDRATTTLVIEAPDRHEKLTRGQLSQIYRFIKAYQDEARGRLIISTPRSAGARHATKPVVRAVERLLDDNGIERGSVSRRRHHNRRGWPVVRLAYRKPVIVAPQCGDWSEDVAVNRERIHYPNFGCATQRNLAATVDNARDLLRPRTATPRSSERRSSDWKKYISGKSKDGSQEAGAKSATTKN